MHILGPDMSQKYLRGIYDPPYKCRANITLNPIKKTTIINKILSEIKIMNKIINSQGTRDSFHSTT